MNSSPDPAGAGFIVGIVLFYGFFILLGLASFIFWIVEIIDVAKRQWADSNTKLVWLLVVILGHGLGALVYYFAGKPTGWLPGEAPKYAGYPPTSPPYSPPPPPGQWPPPPGA